MQAPGRKEGESLTYRQLWDTVRGYAAELKRLGVSRGDRIVIVSENCIEWALTDWASQVIGAVVVPIYPTLPADQAGYIVKDSGAKLVVAGGKEQAAKTAGLEGVRTVLLKEELHSAATSGAGLADAEMDAEIDAAKPEEMCTIIYTSGTTGLPKGVMLNHRAFIHVCHHAREHVDLSENDVFLSFLPMSHVYERVAGQVLPIYLGATLGYAKSLMTLANDMQAVRPTIMLCVPRFLESFRERALDAAEKMPPLRKKLFHLCLAQGTKKARGGSAPLLPLLDKLVASKLRTRVGGRLRYFASGGAALPPAVAEFYIAFGLTVLQGYGLTETTGGTCVNHPERNKYWTVGEPLGMEIKIAEDGEILIKGPALMMGYYNLPEETAKAINADGWFHTGDIGKFEGKSLKITDRKKDLIVLGNGKNVAPQPIENKLKASSLITEAVVFGDGMEYCVALICPNFEAVKARLASGGETVPADDQLITDDRVKAMIKKEIEAVNKTLANFELVKKHALLSQPFSVDSGELTPTLKVKRKVVREKFADLIAGMRG